MIFSIAFDFAIEIGMNDTPQGDGNIPLLQYLITTSLSPNKNE